MSDAHDSGTRERPVLTPTRRRQIDADAGVLDDPARHITFQHTVFCQTSLPFKNPGASVREWERRQGTVLLRVEAGAALDPSTERFVKLGLPYGSRPRLVLAHLNAQALRQRSCEIEVEDSLTAFVKRLHGYDPNGREIRRFKDQLSRLAAATIRMAVSRDGRAFQVNAPVIEAFDLWLTKDERQRVLWPSTIRLNPTYFDSLTRHAVPLHERSLGALAKSPLALDVYAWLAQRLHRIPPGKPQGITWQAFYEQFGQGYRQLKFFRRECLRVLAAVHAQYRAARIEVGKEGLILRHSPPPVPGRLHLIGG
jgi:hypothetical protein